MKAQDIVDLLSANIPLHTDGFSESLAISSITVAGTTATVTTSGSHTLVDGDTTAVLGVLAPVEIDTGTFVRTGVMAVFETLQDHDLTLSQRDIASGGKTITISGATEAEFNGTFTLLKVNNRRKLTISVADSGPTTISGSPIVEDANGAIFNGFVTVSNTTATTFEYTIPISYTVDPVVDNATIQTSIRIISVLDIQQYLGDVYTNQVIDDDILVVQLGDVTVSKSRVETSDASTTSRQNESFNELLIQTFSVYTVMNSTQQLTATALRDKVESEYVPAILKSVLRAQFNSGFTYNTENVTFISHGVFGYSDETGMNKALYAHELNFETTVQLTGEDALPEQNTVAMRDVSYTLTTNLGTGELLADVDLDEEPIP